MARPVLQYCDAYLQPAWRWCALSVHAWVGMWTISTDYLTPMALGKVGDSAVRFLFQAVCGVAMFSFFVWGVQILWGN